MSADKLATMIATCGGIGYAPKAPGTWGSIPGLALGVALHELCGLVAKTFTTDDLADHRWPYLLVAIPILAGLTAISLWAISSAERQWGSHDDGRIVIDEVIGQAIAVLIIVPSWPMLILAFVLFRIFDILKPFPVGWLDRHGPGAFGTLSDDIAAGLMAGCLAALVSGFPW